MSAFGGRRAVRSIAGLVALACVVGIAALTLQWMSGRSSTTTNAGSLPAAASGHGRDVRAAISPALKVPTVERDRLGSRSARLSDLHEKASIRPVAVRIEGSPVGGSVVAVGVDPGGALAVPPDPTVVAWYQYGPSPGEAGSAVLAAHVDYGGRAGVFFHLADVQPGSVVVVTYADRSQRRFVVDARRHYPKSDLPTTALFARTGASRLALVTCGGEFDDAARSYRENIVVYAREVR